MSDTTPVDLDDLRQTNMTDDQYERFIRMEIELKNLRKDNEQQFTLLRSIEGIVNTLNNQLAAGKLSWKILAALGGLLLAFLGAVATALPWLAGHLKIGP